LLGNALPLSYPLAHLVLFFLIIIF
jgi:hypothetical protein